MGKDVVKEENNQGDTIEISAGAMDSLKQKVEALKEKTKAARKAKKSAKAEKETKAQEEKKAEEKRTDVELLQILNAQNDILDCMLTQQGKIHSNIKGRNWVELERSINNMKSYSDAFVNLDQCRENYVGDEKSLYLLPDIEPVFVNVRTKLSKSKIENAALATYVSSTKEFIDGVLDECVPQKRNTLYTSSGQMVKTQHESVMIDAVI